MARGFNKVVIMGNLARDPEVRYTASKTAVASMTVAVGHKFKSKAGAVVDQTDFIPVVVWDKAAENCEKFLKKGRPVLVEGRLQVRSYETKEGEKRYATEVVANNVVFLGGMKAEDGGKKDGFGETPPVEEFPMDISEAGEGAGDANIPF
jgi:single-strand DNA-binding protein